MSQPHTVFKYAHDFRVNGNLNFKSSLFLFPGRGGKKLYRCDNIWVSMVPDSVMSGEDSSLAPAPLSCWRSGYYPGNTSVEVSLLHLASVYRLSLLLKKKKKALLIIDSVNIIHKVSWFFIQIRPSLHETNFQTPSPTALGGVD